MMTVEQVVRPTIAYSYVRGVIVYVGTDVEPNLEDWRRYVEFVRLKKASRSLVCAGKGAPDAAQRRELHEATSGIVGAVAVLTTSAVARTIVGLLSWVHPGYRAFAPEDTRGAMAHLGLYGREADEVCAEMAVLRRRVQVKS